MDDVIYRQDAIDKLRSNLTYMQVFGVDRSITLIDEVPSAERHGKWLDGYGFAGNYYDCFVCDQCKKESMAKTNYCPNCGARMDGKQDG